MFNQEGTVSVDREAREIKYDVSVHKAHAYNQKSITNNKLWDFLLDNQ